MGLAAIMLLGSPARGQPAQSVERPSSAASGQATIPAGTSVTLRIKQQVSSRTAKRGDLFEIELVPRQHQWHRFEVVI